jgi:hypothetical protein
LGLGIIGRFYRCTSVRPNAFGDAATAGSGLQLDMHVRWRVDAARG